LTTFPRFVYWNNAKKWIRPPLEAKLTLTQKPIWLFLKKPPNKRGTEPVENAKIAVPSSLGAQEVPKASWAGKHTIGTLLQRVAVMVWAIARFSASGATKRRIPTVAKTTKVG